jgi:hypothetical protein
MSLNYRLIAVVCSSVFLLGSAGPQAAIEAEVKGVDGRPSKGAEVRIERRDKKAPPIVVKTDKRGRLIATNLAVGVYMLTATVEGGIHASQLVKTQADKPTLVAFDMAKTPAMTSKPKKRYIWVQAETGTRIGGHWVEADGDTQSTANGQPVDRLSGSALDSPQMRMAAPPPGSR